MIKAWHESLIAKIDGIANSMTLSFVEFKHPIDLHIDIANRASTIKKVRLWSLIIGVFVVVGSLGQISDPEHSALVETITAIIAAVITYGVWLWCQSSLKYLRAAQIACKTLIERDPDLKEQLKGMQAAMQNASMEAAQYSDLGNSQEVERLQDEMKKELSRAAWAESQGDLQGAGIYRARATVIESKLRGLGH